MSSPAQGGTPSTLTIAGSDSGGGAGLQADLKTFAALRTHGLCAVTCVTAQNPDAVHGVQPIRASLVRQQIRAVMDAFHPAAVKTGMLFSTAVIRAVVEELRPQAVPLIVDPVMMATSGAPLLQPGAVRALTTELFPWAELITPNLDEASFLLGTRLNSPEALRAAARALHQRFGCAALVKGGHLRGRTAIDFFFDGQTELLLGAPYIRGVSTHGTGCTYSAAIAAWRSRGAPLPEAVRRAKEFISNAIARSLRSGGQSVLHSFWESQA